MLYEPFSERAKSFLKEHEYDPLYVFAAYMIFTSAITGFIMRPINKRIKLLKNTVHKQSDTK